DFHPFNILFREGTDFTLLDASRGGAGDPADDVTSLTANFLAFSLIERGRFEGPLRALWSVFWRTYLEATGDRELLGVVAPFYAWRVLVLASPVWFPQMDVAVRQHLLGVGDRLPAGAGFDP